MHAFFCLSIWNLILWHTGCKMIYTIFMVRDIWINGNVLVDCKNRNICFGIVHLIIGYHIFFPVGMQYGIKALLKAMTIHIKNTTNVKMEKSWVPGAECWLLRGESSMLNTITSWQSEPYLLFVAYWNSLFRVTFYSHHRQNNTELENVRGISGS